MRRNLILVVVLATVVVLLILTSIFSWFWGKQEKVSANLSKSSFPFTDYAQDELNKKFVQEPNKNILTSQDSKETLNEFLIALGARDFERAVECCFADGDRVKMLSFLQEVDGKDMLSLMISDLSTNEREFQGDTRASYSYAGTHNGESVSNVIVFKKNKEGVWLIETL